MSSSGSKRSSLFTPGRCKLVDDGAAGSDNGTSLANESEGSFIFTKDGRGLTDTAAAAQDSDRTSREVDFINKEWFDLGVGAGDSEDFAGTMGVATSIADVVAALEQLHPIWKVKN